MGVDYYGPYADATVSRACGLGGADPPYGTETGMWTVHTRIGGYRARVRVRAARQWPVPGHGSGERTALDEWPVTNTAPAPRGVPAGRPLALGDLVYGTPARVHHVGLYAAYSSVALARLRASAGMRRKGTHPERVSGGRRSRWS
jgi:hypothetical protein